MISIKRLPADDLCKYDTMQMFTPCISALLLVMNGCIFLNLPITMTSCIIARPTGHPGGAYELVNRLEKLNDTNTLTILQNALTEREGKKKQLHKVF